MVPVLRPKRGTAQQWVRQPLDDLYKDEVVGKSDYDGLARKLAPLFNTKGRDPSILVPRILLYLRDNDVGRDARWSVNFPLIRGYLADVHRQMVTGSLGFGDPKLRAALEDARVMVKVHLEFEKRAQETTTPWTTDILRGQTIQERLLTHPGVFPLPDPDRAKSRYRPVKPMPRPDDTSNLRDLTLPILDPAGGSPMLADVDAYVESENRFFRAFQQCARTGLRYETTWEKSRFDVENQAYEFCISRGIAATCGNAPPPYIGDSASRKNSTFYTRRGWQRAALQQCLNIFTSHENRVINTPWRRSVLPYPPPAPLPKEIAYVPRVVPGRITNEREKDPFSWLHWSYQHMRIVDFLADCQRRQYNVRSWNDFLASELPINFRGPRIYRGLAVHDRHWLKIGEDLENLENKLHSAWGAAPRPLLRAILRDIDAGRRENTGGPDMDNSKRLPTEDDNEMQDRKRYWRRDIKRRAGIDNRENNTNDDNFKLVGDLEVSWLRHLCEPSRTLEMCDPSKRPTRNLAILFDAKLQSYFRNLEISGTPDSKALHVWAENNNDLDRVARGYKPNTLRTVVAYINGSMESEVKETGDTDPNPEHPNATYQFSLEEAEFLCVELQNLGRCEFIPEHGREPPRVNRPVYNVHPEDRVLWRHADLQEFYRTSAEYLENMVDHYDAAYGSWPLYWGNRPRLSRELEFMLDHAGPEFPLELERVEIEEKGPNDDKAYTGRRAFIKQHLVPEGLCHIGDLKTDSVENERDAPSRDDLAPWDVLGAYLTKYHEQQKEQHNATNLYYPGETYQPQTPERTVQFFRNLAYRMGRTMRYVAQIRERLQYLENENGRKPESSTSPLDLSTDLKEPRPESNASANPTPAPTVVEKWWHAISAKDYNIAIDKWSTAVREGSGDMALLPPDIKDVLAKADPDSSFQNPLKGYQDPFTVIREGIIDDCFQNRPAMYPSRLSGFRDRADKEFQAYERPNLFVWATKDQRRYQAQHTRQHFFNMQRWPPSRILPHRLTAIQERKDEVSRVDPSKPDQAYGILTNRLPVGQDKPLYARPIVHHDRDWEDWRDLELDQDIDVHPTNDLGGNNDNNTNNLTAPQSTMEAKGPMGETVLPKPTRELVPFARSDEKFAPGPAIFPMGDTLLQKVLISHELNNALYPQQPFYKDRFLGLPKVLGKFADAKTPRIPLVPQVARSSIPRSNPRKRKMPIEFLNGSSTTKKFRSDVSAPLQPGGSGGQFAAATMAKQAPSSPVAGATYTPAKSTGKAERRGSSLEGYYLTPVTTTSDETKLATADGGIHSAQSAVSSTSGTTKKRVTPRGAVWDDLFTRSSSAITGPIQGGAAPATLRVHPDPSRTLARSRFIEDFPQGWISTPTELQHLFTSATMALEFSINRQLAAYGRTRTTHKELNNLAKSLAALQPFTQAKNNFDIHCLSRLVEAYGEKHNLQLQLGVAQDDPNHANQLLLPGDHPTKFAAYLVGSKYNDAPDKVVVWVRLAYIGKYSNHLVNPYSNLSYNCYKGIGSRKEGRSR